MGIMRAFGVAISCCLVALVIVSQWGFWPGAAFAGVSGGAFGVFLGWKSMRGGE